MAKDTATVRFERASLSAIVSTGEPGAAASAGATDSIRVAIVDPSQHRPLRRSDFQSMKPAKMPSASNPNPQP